MKKLIILGLIVLTQVSQAAVWKAKPGLNWDAYWDKKFETWVKEEVEGDFFKKLGSRYKSLPLDCADAFYGLRVYFSYKKKLPWRSDAQKWNDHESYSSQYSNEMTNWDHLENEEDRVAELIRFLVDRVGTESLANLDSYPIPLMDVRAGDVYMYKYGSDGSYTRHAYIIKEVNSDGTFDVLYGTQLRAKKLWPLGKTGNEYLQHKPDNISWGFKRYKSNLDTKTKESKIIVSNFEQYEVAKRINEEQFFDYVNVALRVFEETPTRKTKRLLDGLCRSLQAREIVINDAIQWQDENRNRCMNEADYDAYSTPSRDTGIKKKYQQLKSYFEKIRMEGREEKVSSYYRNLVNKIFDPFQRSYNDNDVMKFCSVDVGSSSTGYKSVDLGNFYQALMNNQVSFHPNDNILRRWGFSYRSKTRCREYYGYSD